MWAVGVWQSACRRVAVGVWQSAWLACGSRRVVHAMSACSSMTCIDDLHVKHMTCVLARLNRLRDYTQPASLRLIRHQITNEPS